MRCKLTHKNIIFVFLKSMFISAMNFAPCAVLILFCSDLVLFDNKILRSIENLNIKENLPSIHEDIKVFLIMSIYFTAFFILGRVMHSLNYKLGILL